MYRVTYTGKDSTAPSMGSKEGADARALRKKLEAFHGKQDPKAIDVAWPYLGHQDRFIRFSARLAIEFQDVTLWQDKALAEKEPQAALTALLALTRTGPKSVQPQLLDALAKIDWQPLSHAQKLDLLRVYALAFMRLGAPNEATAAKVIARFDPVYPADTVQLNNELCKLLVYLQAPSAAAKSMKLLHKALTQEEQLQYALSLRELKKGWTTKEHEEYFQWFLKAASYKGGNSFRKFIERIRDDAIKNLTPTEAAQLKPILDLKLDVAKPVLAPPRPFVKKWTIAEVEQVVTKGLKNRNFDKGRAMFAAANCFACHRFANEGGSTGPDLTGIGSRYSIHDLVEKVITPSKAISDQYQAVLIELKNGQVVQGRVVNLFVDDIVISTDPYDPNKLTNVNRNQIATITPSPISMMPTGLLDTLHDDEVLDLLAYLLSGGNREHALFAKKE
jgi:putative heme-binding domain-containing protein